MNEARWLLELGLGAATPVMLALWVLAGAVNAGRATPWRTPRFAVAEIRRQRR